MNAHQVLDELSDVYLQTRRSFLADITKDKARTITADDEVQGAAIKATLLRAELAALIAADAAKGVASAVRDEGLVTLPYVAARTCLECSTICVWLLEPEVPWRQRIERCWEVRFGETTEAKKMASAIGEQAVMQETAGLLEGLEDQAHRLKIAKRFGANQRLTGYGAESFKRSKLVKRLWETPGLYPMLSSISHGVPWGASKAGLVSAGEQPLFEQVPYFELHRDAEGVTFVITAVARQLIGCFTAVVDAHGWMAEEEWRETVDDLLRPYDLEVAWGSATDSTA